MRSLATLLALAGTALFSLAAAKPEKIRGVRDPIYHLYLQHYPKDPTKVVLGPEATAEEFDIGGTIKSTETGLYININSDDPASYKSLGFGETGTTTAWGLEGDTIITKQGTSFGRREFYPPSLSSYFDKHQCGLVANRCFRTQLPRLSTGRWLLGSLPPDRK
jgi:hypothetical protein